MRSTQKKDARKQAETGEDKMKEPQHATKEKKKKTPRAHTDNLIVCSINDDSRVLLLLPLLPLLCPLPGEKSEKERIKAEKKKTLQEDR